MATYNFGMLTAGMPDPTLRQVSTAVGPSASATTAQWGDWQKRYDALLAQSNIANPSDYGAAAFGMDPGMFADPLSTAYTGPNAAAFQALQQERLGILASGGPQSAMSTGLMDATNQKAQQDAYNAAGGGSYLGGNINQSYATPNAGLDPNSALNGMLNQQPWSMPGFGGPTGGASQSGFGTNTGNAWGGSQPSGWGGPFTAKNPWAAS